MTKNNWALVAAIFLSALVADCVTAPGSTARVTTVSIRHGGETDQIFVDGQAVTPQDMANQALNHAIEDNPTMPISNVYRDARIVIRSDSRVRFGIIQDVMMRLTMEGFENLCLEERGRQTCATRERDRDETRPVI